MAKKQTAAATTTAANLAAAAPVAAAPVANGEPNKAEAVREYWKSHPTEKPADISRALEAQGIKVGSGRIADLIRKFTAGPKLDVGQIKAAAAFVRSFDKEDVADGISHARVAIEAAGVFVEECGSASKALAALDAYEAVAAAVA